jgi:hypothetical protein
MSHFYLLAEANPEDGNTLDNLLQPYHEFECTGINDQYVVDVDTTESRREEYERHLEDSDFNLTFAEFCGPGYYNGKFLYPNQAIDTSEGGPHRFGYVELDEKGEVVKVIDRTNPKAQWDWWVMGGRFSNRLLLKDGSEVNYAKKRDIDVEGLRTKAVDEAGQEYEEVWAVIANTEPHITWDEYTKSYPEQDNTFYREQERVKVFNKWIFQDYSNRGHVTLDKVASLTKEQYQKDAFNRAFCPFVFLSSKGEWYEKGEMGWWGCVSNENSDWPSVFRELFEALPEDTVLTVVDCHI